MTFIDLKRNLAALPISVVIKLTDLSARQIRYYEEKNLIKPERTNGNTRLFSLNDVDKLMSIKDLINKGFSIKAIDEIINNKKVDNEINKLRQIIHNDIFTGPIANTRNEPIGRGDLARFYTTKK
ncbi:MAG: MerR family transcriptional regulator [Gemella sp.]|nr:MerR family transcriptional regulator [Gemella sp.]